MKRRYIVPARFEFQCRRGFSYEDTVLEDLGSVWVGCEQHRAKGFGKPVRQLVHRRPVGLGMFLEELQLPFSVLV
jgi:hypothetical protein